jgi:hypothetical protein
MAHETLVSHWLAVCWKPEEARTALGEALSGLDDHAVKQRAMFLTDLATTSVRDLYRAFAHGTASC